MAPEHSEAGIVAGGHKPDPRRGPHRPPTVRRHGTDHPDGLPACHATARDADTESRTQPQSNGITGSVTVADERRPSSPRPLPLHPVADPAHLPDAISHRHLP